MYEYSYECSRRIRILLALRIRMLKDLPFGYEKLRLRRTIRYTRTMGGEIDCRGADRRLVRRGRASRPLPGHSGNVGCRARGLSPCLHPNASHPKTKDGLQGPYPKKTGCKGRLLAPDPTASTCTDSAVAKQSSTTDTIYINKHLVSLACYRSKLLTAREAGVRPRPGGSGGQTERPRVGSPELASTAHSLDGNQVLSNVTAAQVGPTSHRCTRESSWLNIGGQATVQEPLR